MLPSLMHVAPAKQSPKVVRAQSGIVGSRKASPMFCGAARAATNTFDDPSDLLGNPEVGEKLWDVRDNRCGTRSHSLRSDYAVNVSESINGAAEGSGCGNSNIVSNGIRQATSQACVGCCNHACGLANAPTCHLCTLVTAWTKRLFTSQLLV